MHLSRKTGELMEQIEAVERRIAAALGRIGSALAQPDARAAYAAKLEADWATAQAKLEAALAEVERLSQALEDEQLVARQIQARNDALSAKLDTFEAETAADMAAFAADAEASRAAAAEAEAKSERLRGELLVRDALTSQLRRVNLQLRQNNLALRDAVLKGMPDPNLVNKAMLTELESIRTSRDAERAEIDAILEELRVILETGKIVNQTEAEAAAQAEATAGAKAAPDQSDAPEADALAEDGAQSSSDEEAKNA